VFLEEPGHRIVTAVHHFFSAQFADSFTHPWESDCTSYCSCLEASLNIDPFAGKLHNRLYDRLSVMLGGRIASLPQMGRRSLRGTFRPRARERWRRGTWRQE
jgi:hypothetical protein